MCQGFVLLRGGFVSGGRPFFLNPVSAPFSLLAQAWRSARAVAVRGVGEERSRPAWRGIAEGFVAQRSAFWEPLIIRAPAVEAEGRGGFVRGLCT